MPDKEETIKLLEKASYWEEDFILKYDNPSFLALLRTLPKEKYKRIEKLFQQNIADTKRHASIVKELIKNGKF